MHYLKLIFKNIFRHKLRSSLTIVGLVIAILAFGLLRTVVNAWYAGADMASAQRLITRNATSLVFALPAYYRERIRAVDGVNKVVISNWFGGIYKDQSFGNFFAQFAIDGPFFDLYPEFIVKPEEIAAWKADRRGAMVGRLLADTYGFKVGDRIALKGAIYGGDWEFTVRGIYEPKDDTTVTRQMYFHWDYLNEVMKKRFPKRAEFAGVFIVQIADGSRAAEISQAVDREFRNSLAETLTETEKAFQLGFVAQTEAIVTALKIVSFVVIVIILAVVANTMAMTARERLAEYATLKALGFSPAFVAALIVGESVMMTALGGAIGIAFTFPVAAGFKKAMGTFFPVFHVTEDTLKMQLAAAITVGVLAAILPSIRAARVRIVEGLKVYRVKIPFSYIFRNLWTRKLTTLLTSGGMALVVFVFAAVLMLDAGLKKTLVSTGSFENAILLRASAQTEIQSSVTRDQASLIETIPEVARGTDGAPLVSKEVLVLTQIASKGGGKAGNVIVRGLPAMGIRLRPQVHIVDGRMFRPGTSEIIVGRSIANGFEGTDIGATQRFAGREWTVVGIFDAGKSGFDSEMWGDVEQMMQAFRRGSYSSTIARLEDRSAFEAFKARIAGDQRLVLDVKQEPLFYEEQSKQLSTFISILGITLSVIFSIGAMIGAMITMYAAVSQRTGEIGTLRALGFRRSSILAAFLIESVLLSLVGGAIGLALASGLQAFTITTMNWQSFSQLAFGFHLTPSIVMLTIAFSMVMGFVGGFLPSVRAAKLEIVDSLRAA